MFQENCTSRHEIWEVHGRAGWGRVFLKVPGLGWDRRKVGSWESVPPTGGSWPDHVLLTQGPCSCLIRMRCVSWGRRLRTESYSRVRNRSIVGISCVHGFLWASLEETLTTATELCLTFSLISAGSVLYPSPHKVFSFVLITGRPKRK